MKLLEDSRPTHVLDGRVRHNRITLRRFRRTDGDLAHEVEVHRRGWDAGVTFRLGRLLPISAVQDIRRHNREERSGKKSSIRIPRIHG